MNYKVKVVANPETGNIVTQNKNKPEYGSIRFDQKKFVLSGGFLSLKNKVFFMNGTMDDLLEYSHVMNFTNGKELPGVVYTVERKQPFYEDQEPKINPTTGNMVLVDGEPVFQNTYYDETGTSTDDLLVGIKSIGPKFKEVSVSNTSIATSSLGNQ